MAFTKITAALLVISMVLSSTYAQNFGAQGGEDEGYVNSLMSTVSNMDWQGMLRTIVETAMQYFAAPTNRIDETSRSFGRNEADLVVNFVEQTPFIRYYVEAAHDVVVLGADMVNSYL